MLPSFSEFYITNRTKMNAVHVAYLLLEKALLKQLSNFNHLFLFQNCKTSLLAAMVNAAVFTCRNVLQVIDRIVSFVFAFMVSLIPFRQWPKKGTSDKSVYFDTPPVLLSPKQADAQVPLAVFDGTYYAPFEQPLSSSTLPCTIYYNSIQTPHPSGIAHLIQPFVSRHVLPNLITHDMRSNRKRPTQSTSTICQDVRKSKLNGAFVNNYNTTTTRLGNSKYTTVTPIEQVFYPTIQGAST